MNAEQNRGYTLELVWSLTILGISILPFGNMFASVWIVLLWAVPLLIEIGRERSFIPTSIISYVGFANVIGFSLPSFVPGLLEESSLKVSMEFVDMAAYWSLIGMSAMYSAYFAIVRSGSSIITTGFELSDLFVLKALGIASFSAGLAIFILKGGQIYVFVETSSTASSNSYDQALSFLSSLGYIYLYLYRAISADSAINRTRLLKFLFAAIIALKVFYIVGAGAKAESISLILVLMIPTKKAASLRSLMFGLVLSLFAVVSVYSIFQVISNYRQIMASAGVTESQSIASEIAVQFNAFGTALEQSVGLSNDVQSAVVEDEEIIDRFAHLTTFGLVLEHANGESKYENWFQSFLLPVYAVIPRDIVDKPIFFGSGQLAAMEGWKFGGISVTYFGSLFWAWGLLGIPFGMALTGIFLAMVQNNRYKAAGKKVMHICIWLLSIIYMLDVGIQFQPFFLNIIRLYILFYILYWCASYFIRASRTNRIRIKHEG